MIQGLDHWEAVVRGAISFMGLFTLMAILACGGGSGSTASTKATPPPPPPAPRRWVVQDTGSMSQPRDNHTATLLPNGSVLIIGGQVQGDGMPRSLTSAELYDPTTGAFAPAGDLHRSRVGHSAILLPDGRVAVLGGFSLVDGNAVKGLRTVEIWDPVTRSFSEAGSLVNDRTGSQAFLRQDNRIQVVGGFDPDLPIAADTFRTEVFDPSTGTSQLDFPLYELEMDSTLVPVDSAHFMLLGGENGIGYWHQLDSAYLYATDGSTPNPSAGGAMSYAFTTNSGVRIPSGKVLAGGGYNQINGMSQTISIIDYAHLGSPIQAVPMLKVRMGHQTILLPDGNVGFVAGETFTGAISTTYLSDIEVLDLASLKTRPLPVTLRVPRSRHTVTPLLDGSFLVIGGFHYQPGPWIFHSLSSCEVLAYR